jgi:outer membrane protein assembly factor BamB
LNQQESMSTLARRLRVWPGVLIVSLQWLGKYVVPAFFPEALIAGIFAGLGGGLLVALWWVFFSRAPLVERVGAIVLMVAALVATSQLLHVSLATAGMGFLYWAYAIPLLSLAFVAWAVVARGLSLSDGARRLSMVATILIACGVWALVRTGGITGDTRSDFAWRWSETSEDRLLANVDDEVFALPSTPDVPPTEADWPGFRGPNRDSVIRGLRIETDWTKSPPVEAWRRPIGPGWSSFAVQGDFLYTQEQRGEEEIVSCYDTKTGQPVWRHSDTARFYESNGGPGPRGTPTLWDGRVYSFGATGILNVLDAGDGSVVWARDVSADADRRIPGWGFSSSPLVADDTVFVAAADKLVAYDVATGEPRWVGPPGGGGYSSPHLLTIDGVLQLVLARYAGIVGVAPDDGTVLWQYEWREGTRIVQPALTADGGLLLSAGEGRGMRRLAVSRGPEGWNVEERWTSIRLKPYFNDFVVHEGHAYGFDGSILACVDVEDGSRKWKGGRYGHGQLVLLPDQDVLLVLTEDGELALVAARPDAFEELARIPAIEGKTWNHPVLVRDLLLVRNGEQMAAFRLALPAT